MFLGLGLPLAFLLSATVADHLTSAVWDQHMTVIAGIMADVGPQDGSIATDSESWRAWLAQLLDDVDRYQEIAKSAFDHADALIGSYLALLSVFVFKIFLLPALIAGALYMFARFFAGQDGRT